MDPIRQGLESRTVCGGRESACGRYEDAVGIPHVLAVFEGFGEGILHVPAFVDDGVLPTELAHASEHGGIGAVVGLVDGEPVGVPAVPAKGRGGSNDLLRGGELGGEAEDGKTEGAKQLTA